MKVRLTEDIKSNSRQLYGKAGEIVTIISDHGNVLIVKGKQAFPVSKSKTDLIDTNKPNV